MGGADTTESVFASWKLAATAIFVLLNGFFVAAEFALVKVRPTRIEALAAKGHRRARIALGMVQRMDVAGHAWVHPVALAIALTIVTVLHMTVGEQAPKMYSIQSAESTILAFAYPLYLFAWLLRPMIWVINWISNGLVRIAGIARGSEHEGTYDLQELRAILDDQLDVGSYRATVVAVTGRRASRVRFEKTPPPDPAAEVR